MSVFVWTISDVIGIVALLIIAFIFSVLWSLDAWDRFKCKHDGGVNETQACEAICKICGKNLGFIGNYRKEAKQ